MPSSVAHEEKPSRTSASNGRAKIPAAAASKNARRCQNCNADLMGNYCYSCGQRTDVQRLTLSTLFRGALERVLNLDSAYLRTFTGMIRRPGKLISAYVDGERKPYVNPVSFFLLTITFTVVLRWAAADLGLWKLVNETARKPTVNRYMYNHRWILNSIFQLPLTCTLTLLFWGSKRNIAEHCAFGFFVTGMAFFYMTIGEFTGFHLFGPDGIGTIVLIGFAFWASLIYAGMNFYRQRSAYIILKMFFAFAGTFLISGLISKFLLEPLLAHLLHLPLQ